MELLNTKVASSNCLQLCILLGIESKQSAYSSSGLELYVHLETEGTEASNPWTSAAAVAHAFSAEPWPPFLQRELGDGYAEPPKANEEELHSMDECCSNLSENRTRVASLGLDTLADVDKMDERLAPFTNDSGNEFEESGRVGSMRLPQFRDSGPPATANPANILSCPSGIVPGIECFDMADVSAACHLLELSSYSGSVDSCGQEPPTDSHESARDLSKFYIVSPDFQELSELVEEIHTTLDLPEGISPRLAWTSDQSTTRTQFTKLSHDSSTLRKRRIRANQIRHPDPARVFGFDVDDCDVLDRPPNKRHYKSLHELLHNQ